MFGDLYECVFLDFSMTVRVHIENEKAQSMSEDEKEETLGQVRLLIGAIPVPTNSRFRRTFKPLRYPKERMARD